ncbi:MAG: alpha/beta fold hydrolase [Vulcanimicrobiaceae bacterium]
MLNADAPPGWRPLSLRAAGLALAAFEAGTSDGPPVLLLHGLGLWSELAWGRLVPLLPPGRRWIALDLPGFGASAKPAARYDAAFFRHVLTDVVAQLGGRLALVGHSLGGLLAADLAGVHPERVSQLALVAPAGFAHPRRHLALALVARVVEPLFLLPPRRALVAATLRGSVADPASLDPAAVAHAYRLASDRALRRAFARVYAAGLPALTSAGRHRAQLASFARYAGPVLCVWGRADRYLPITALETVRRVYPQAVVTILERSGHLPMVEEPAAFARALEAFLVTNRPS